MSRSRIDVLIVGAGPTGLMLACQLSLHPNISVRIVDKNSGPTTQSRAIGIQARTLELFSQLGIIDRVLSAGELGNSLNIFFYGRRCLRIELERIRTDPGPPMTRFPFLLMLNQSITEQLLESFINERGINVERNSEVIDVTTVLSDDEIEARMINGEIIRTKYVCACDGARSIVRHKLALPFVGRTY